MLELREDAGDAPDEVTLPPVAVALSDVHLHRHEAWHGAGPVGRGLARLAQPLDGLGDRILDPADVVGLDQGDGRVADVVPER